MSSDLVPPQRIPGLTPYLCEYQGPDGVYGITLHATDPEQIVRDHGAELYGLKVVGVLEGTIDKTDDPD